MLKLFLLNIWMTIGLIDFVYCISACNPRSAAQVMTSSGLIVGIPANEYLLVDQYLSIPYAAPPVGNLRFVPPQPFACDGVIDATQLPPYCVQPSNVNFSEDCLFLNIYVPQNRHRNFSPKPVMFWIHGGSFLTGGSADPTFNGSILAQNENVIVITTNYRLGFLGFYDSAETGTNFGVEDVIAALEWVQGNIHQFGGDPQQVTVFGQSSGATLIRTLINSSKARGKFSRAILESDPQNYGANYPNVSRGVLSPFLEDLTGCSRSSNNDPVQCLRNLSVDAILEAEINSNITALPGVNPIYPFGPNIDDRIISTRFGFAVEKGNLLNDVDMIIGFVKDETGSVLSEEFPQLVDQQVYADYLVYSFGEQGALKLLDSPLFKTMFSISTSGEGYIEELEAIGTEYEFSCPIQLNAGVLAARKLHRIYVYELVQGIQYPTNEGAYLCDKNDAVCHEDDLYVVFGTYPISTTTTSQVNLSRQVQSRWAAFAATGNPNTAEFGDWLPAVSLTDLNIYLLGNDTVVPSVNFEQCNFFETNNIPFNWERSE